MVLWGKGKGEGKEKGKEKGKGEGKSYSGYLPARSYQRRAKLGM